VRSDGDDELSPTAAHDARVPVSQPAKMAARLQSATASGNRFCSCWSPALATATGFGNHELALSEEMADCYASCSGNSAGPASRVTRKRALHARRRRTRGRDLEPACIADHSASVQPLFEQCELTAWLLGSTSDEAVWLYLALPSEGGGRQGLASA
jgi:hypothetical protein